ncbi:MAG TPA: LamG-like jellyroll fold domain-containing protein [Verrucomicrobiae bacterium]|nr:LamG-like jellyroll fold domain-containing protein [Verrucomicrobiae bacterium]
MKPSRILTLCALAALGWATTASGQIQVAGNLQINVDATTAPVGPLNYLTNSGVAGGVFLAGSNGVAAVTPQIVALGGNGTHGVLFDGNAVFLQHFTAASGGTAQLVPGGFTGSSPVFSVELWMYKPTVTDETAPVSWGTRANGQEVSCNWGRNGTWGGFSWYGGGYDYSWASYPSAGAWHHLVWTYDGAANLKLYRDGVLDKAVTITSIPSVSADYNILLGAQHAGTSLYGFANGVLGRVRIHDGVLDASQVLSNYNFEVGSFTNGTAAQFLAGQPLHRYSFNIPATNDAVGLTVIDTGTANGTGAQANGVVKGNAGTANTDGVQINLNGGSSASAAYIDLPNGLLSSLSVSNGGPGKVTFEMWVTPTSAQNWSRIFDFGSNTLGEVTGPGGTFNGVNYFGYIAQPGGDQEHSQIGGVTGGLQVGSRLLDSQKHIVVTWDEPSNTVKIYHQGVLAGSFTVTTKMNSVSDINDWLGRSNYNGDSNFAGGFREFRIYNRILSDAEIRRDYIVGPADTSDASTLVWNGNVDGNWNTGTANWLLNGVSANYTDGSAVLLDDTAAGTTSVSLAANVAPKSVIVANSAKSYTLGGTGSLTGTGSFTKQGTNTLTFAGPQTNSYTGPTYLAGGKVILTNLTSAGLPSALGAAGSNPTNLVLGGGTLSYQGPATTVDRGYYVGGPGSVLDIQNNLTLTGLVRGGGGGGFAKQGLGTLTYKTVGSNVLSGGAFPGYNIVQGTVIFDGTGGGQTNRNLNEFWVGGSTNFGANLIVSNATLLSDSWVSVGRGNGAVGNLSTLTLQNGNLTIGGNGFSMGYNAGLTNRATQVTTLNGSSTLYAPGNVNVGESTGSSASLYLNNSSWLRGNTIRLGMSAGATGAVYIANSAIVTNVGYTSIGTASGVNPGEGGVGRMVVKDNGVYYSTGDFNVTDLANSVGQLDITNNGSVSTGSGFVGKAAGAVGVLNLAGGSLITPSSNFQIGQYGDGTLNQTGGTNIQGAWISIGRYAGGVGTANISGGLFLQTGTGNELIVGEEGTGTLNVSGTAQVILTNRLRIGNAATASGSVNLNGGVIQTKQVFTGNVSGYSIFNFNGGTLRAAPGAASTFMTGLSYVTVDVGGAVIDSGANNITFAQDLYSTGSDGGLTKLGSGQARLMGGLYYYGPTVVSSGTLAVNTYAFGYGSYAVADGAMLTVVVTNLNPTLSASGLKLGSATGAALDFDLGSYGNPTSPVISVAGGVTNAGNTVINIEPSSSLSVGTVPLIQYTTLAGSGTLTLGTLPPGVVANLVTNTGTSTIELDVTSVFQPRWEGLAGGTWDIQVTTNWIDMVTLSPQYFFQGTRAVFDDAALGTTAVNLVTNVAPGGVVVSNTALAYTISGTGRILGGGSLTKLGTNTLTLNTTNNAYSGGTFIDEGGTLITTVANNLGANGSLGIGSGTLTLGSKNQSFADVAVTNGTISAAGATVTAGSYALDNGTISATLAGGSLRTFGTNSADVMSLTATNTYTNQTVLANGTLAVTSLANGGLPSGIGASSANPTNLVFSGGTLSYTGPAVTSDRGYTVTADSTLSVGGDVTLTGPVAANAGVFSKAGAAQLTYARLDTNVLSKAGYRVGQGTLSLVDVTATSYTNSVQTNVITGGDLWVGYDQAHAGALVVSNTSLSVSAWLAIDRGNGTNANSSKASLYNAYVSVGNMSMGYDNGVVGNSEFPQLTLRGNSTLISGAQCFIGESAGSVASLMIADNSSLILRGGWFSVGASGTGTMTLQGAGSFSSTGDFNIGDVGSSAGTLNLSDNASLSVGGLFVASANGSGSTAMGTVNQTNGILTTAYGGDGSFTVGGRNSASALGIGTYNLLGGTVNVGGNVWLGGYGTGTNNQTGGSFNTHSWTSIGRQTGSYGVWNISGGALTHDSTGTRIMVGENGTGILNVSGSGHVTSTGGIRIGNTATADGTINLNGGTITTLRVETTGGLSTFNFNGGTLQAGANTTTFMQGLGSANVLGGGAVIDSSTYTVSIAQALLDGGAGGGLTKLGTGSLYLNGANTYTGLTAVNGGALGGTGVIAGSVNVANTGALAPGGANAVGTLNIGGNLTVNGNLIVKLNKALAQSNDVANVTGTLANTGTGVLTVNNIGTNAVTVGDRFVLFNKPLSGGAALTVIGGGAIWTNNLALDGSITALSTNVVSTAPVTLTNAFVAGSLNLTWPADHTGWRLEVQTNALSVGLGTNWVTWPGSATTNAISIPANPTNPSVFFRLVYP